MEQTSPGDIFSETYVSDFKQDDEGKLIEASATRRTINREMYTELVNSDVTETKSYILKYNEQGFLTEMAITTLTLQEGGKTASFLYANYPPYRHGKIVAKEVNTFQYESDLVRSATRTSVVDFRSERNLDVKVNPEAKKEYIYETGGVIKTITETIGNSSSVTQFENGVKASTPTNKYDEKGQLVQTSSPDSEYNLKYDANGNILSVEAIYQSKQQFLETRTHDSNPNPDKLLPQKFKGIPEEMRILQFTDGSNNLVSSKSVYPDRPPYEEKTVYTYNSTGYPATAVTTFTQSGTLITKTTTYNYQDCQ
ncbi:hypothetical protein [Dyadobacter psychrophilus]|nr:hypothetical protein [Dyadobacter psychrophilus]